MPQADDTGVATSSVTLQINGQSYHLEIGHHRTLLEILRQELGLTGSKDGCDSGECGTCTVLVASKPVYACQLLAVRLGDSPILTVEGLADDTALDPVQQAFLDNDGAQCGFCTPGFLLSAKALLDANPDPSVAEIREALSGNLCRCNAYGRIIHAVQEATR